PAITTWSWVMTVSPPSCGYLLTRLCPVSRHSGATTASGFTSRDAAGAQHARTSAAIPVQEPTATRAAAPTPERSDLRPCGVLLRALLDGGQQPLDRHPLLEGGAGILARGDRLQEVARLVDERVL